MAVQSKLLYKTKYSDGKIYCITSSQEKKIYVGSTIQPLNKRFIRHKSNYKFFLDGKYHKVTSFDNTN